MVFFGHFGGWTLAIVAVVRAACAVPSTTLHQQAVGPEDGVRPFQLLTQCDGKVPWSATVKPYLLTKQVQVHHSYSNKNTQQVFFLKFQYSLSIFKYRIFTSGFLLVEEWFAHHLPGRLVEVLHVHLPAFRLQVFHYFLHRAESSYSFTQNIHIVHPCRHHSRGLGLRLPLNTQIKQTRNQWYCSHSIWAISILTGDYKVFCRSLIHF